MLCGIDLYKLLNYKSNDKHLTIVYSIFIIVFIKNNAKKQHQKYQNQHGGPAGAQ